MFVRSFQIFQVNLMIYSCGETLSLIFYLKCIFYVWFGEICLDLYTTLYMCSDSQDPSPELHRINGDFVSHGLRRNDYSSSPPTRARGEFVSNSRGRWEGRSGGWNDKDAADSHSDRDPGNIFFFFFKLLLRGGLTLALVILPYF